MARLLDGKAVLVTGSTTGIGEATARLCVEEGARVMIHGRDEARAKALSNGLGNAASYVLGDVGDPAVCGRVVQATVDAFGAIHGVVNNAALTWRSTLEETDAETFDRMIAVNLRAPMLIIRAAVPHFRRQGGGSVVNIGSVNALAGQANLLPYSAAKGGLATMSRNLANALAAEPGSMLTLALALFKSTLTDSTPGTDLKAPSTALTQCSQLMFPTLINISFILNCLLSILISFIL